MFAGFPFGQLIASESYVPISFQVEEGTSEQLLFSEVSETNEVMFSPLILCNQTEEKTFPLVTTAQTNPSFPLSQATDGNMSTAWYGNAQESFPKILTMHLKERYCISSFSLVVPHSELPLTFSLETSRDGIIWEEVVHENTLIAERTFDIALPFYVEATSIRLIEFSAARPFGALTEWSVHIGKPLT